MRAPDVGPAGHAVTVADEVDLVPGAGADLRQDRVARTVLAGHGADTVWRRDPLGGRDGDRLPRVVLIEPPEAARRPHHVRGAVDRDQAFTGAGRDTGGVGVVAADAVHAGVGRAPVAVEAIGVHHARLAVNSLHVHARARRRVARVHGAGVLIRTLTVGAEVDRGLFAPLGRLALRLVTVGDPVVVVVDAVGAVPRPFRGRELDHLALPVGADRAVRAVAARAAAAVGAAAVGAAVGLAGGGAILDREVDALAAGVAAVDRAVVVVVAVDRVALRRGDLIGLTLVAGARVRAAQVGRHVDVLPRLRVGGRLARVPAHHVSGGDVGVDHGHRGLLFLDAATEHVDHDHRRAERDEGRQEPPGDGVVCHRLISSSALAQCRYGLDVECPASELSLVPHPAGAGRYFAPTGGDFSQRGN